MTWKQTGWKWSRSPKGHYLCDGCGKKLTSNADTERGSFFLYGYRAHVQYGKCCEEKAIEALRKAGFKFRLSPVSK